MTTSPAVVVWCLAAFAHTPKPQAVHFETTDGVKIEADYYAPEVTPGEKAPVAILIHMYPADRKSWRSLTGPLHEAGFACLAYDIRGKAGSAGPPEKRLREMYEGRDPRLFADAWKDAEAATKWLAGRAECDASRIACIGASIGCSISLEFASREPAVKAVVCLSPGTNYFGVDSIAHIKKCGKRAILLIAPEGEYEAVEKLIQASGGVARAEKHPGGQEHHGTRMFAAAYGPKVKESIVTFVKKAVKT